MLFISPSDFSGVHRSGWKYVTEGIWKSMHDPTSPVLFDAFMDKSFHWSKEFLLEIGVLPYRRPWMGFIHHTPQTNCQWYSPYNVTQMVLDPVFQESLLTCRALIVMTNDLKSWLLAHLSTPVPVYVIDHPTEFVPSELMFNLDAFVSNEDRMVVQIGGWLRNPYHAYALRPHTSGKDVIKIQKAALKGKMMDSYFLPTQSVSDLIVNDGSGGDNSTPCSGGYNNQYPGCSGGYSDDNTTTSDTWKNKYVEGLVHQLESNQTSVKVLERLSNSDYDKLLSENIVTLNLYEVAACNTVIECIVRNTPIIVNRLKGLEEVLGADYPLFYESLDEADTLCTDLNAIAAGYQHLRKLDKTRFTLDDFLVRMKAIVDEVC